MAVLVANINAGGADLFVKPKPVAERASQPSRARQPDAAQRELLFQQFLDWLRAKGLDQVIQLDSDTKVAASASSDGDNTRRVRRGPVEAGLRMSRQL